MSADGAWKITINTPMGAQQLDATITTAGDSFTGVVDGPMGKQDIAGKIDGDNLITPLRAAANKRQTHIESRVSR